MPIGLDKAPQTLPTNAQKLWVKTFNGAFENCKGDDETCDKAAAKMAWASVKRKYRKVKDQWVSRKSEAYHEVSLAITKASLQPDGSVRWQAVASDTDRDKSGERTSTELFQDWIDRVTYKSDIPYLPEPKMPFLGVSHYPALDGYGEAGDTRRMYIDGSTFKADGTFKSDSPIGQKLLNAVKSELALIKKGEQIEKPIRISAGWWDIQHYHDESDYQFTRQSLIDKCPICEKGQTFDKIYQAGQLDHFAATRVPMNPRTSLDLEEKSMAKITRREDAESIIGSDEAEEMERRAKMVGKADTEEGLPPAMVVRGGCGGYMKDKRLAKKMTLADVAKEMDITQARLKRLEAEEEEMDDEAMETMATVLQMSDEEKEEMLARFGSKRKKEPPTKDKAATKTVDGEDYPPGDFLVVEDPEKPTTWHLQVKRDGDPDHGLMGAAWAALHKGYRGNKYEGPGKDEALAKLKKLYEAEEMATPTEKMDYDHIVSPKALGGATSIKEAEGYIETQEKMGKLHSHWDIFRSVVSNIMLADEEAVPDKVKAMSQAVSDLGSRIDTLKAGLSDAFLIQESAAAYQDADDEYFEELEDFEDDEVTTMSDTNQTEHPADLLKAAVDAALENKSLGREDQEKAVQVAFNDYAQSVQEQLDRANPLPPADQIAGAIKGALADVLGPLTEQVGLLTAKMAQQEQAQDQQGLQPVYLPQQKSMIPQQPPQPVQTGQEGGHAVSPVLGKPSALTDIIRKSVGLNQ